MMDALAGSRPVETEPRRCDMIEGDAMNGPTIIQGAIIDSWVEPAGPSRRESRLVLQVAPRGRPDDLMIVEASASLVPDRGWLEDLGENLCHGSPVAAEGRFNIAGQLRATRIELVR
jgi:hypothetical protein